jgi:hypothetical protein
VIAYFVLGIALLAGLYLLARWFSQAEPGDVLKALAWTLGILGVMAGLALLWAGRYQLAWIALPALFALASRWRDIRNAIKSARGPGQGQTSTVETRFVRMTLEHDTGVMAGVVLEGSYEGAQLEDLELEDLIALWREARAEDAQSAAVLEAYLDKLHGDAWREAPGDQGAGAQAGAAPGDGPMGEEEALEILGLSKGASNDEVRRAYRDLMQKLHPDHGGSNWFAAKLNEAKRVLTGE